MAQSCRANIVVHSKASSSQQCVKDSAAMLDPLSQVTVDQSINLLLYITPPGLGGAETASASYVQDPFMPPR